MISGSPHYFISFYMFFQPTFQGGSGDIYHQFATFQRTRDEIRAWKPNGANT
jgi:hypothetical protein